MTLAQIAAHTGIARSSVHRIILELQAQDYVVSASPTGGYRLGPRLVGIALSSYVQLVTALRPMLVGLSRTVRENVDLAMLEHDDVLIVDRIANMSHFSAVADIGKPLSAHANCIGKVLLAQLPEERAREIVERPLRRFTSRTIVDPGRLMDELAQVRSTGIAFDEQEQGVGVSAVAISLRSGMGLNQAVSIVVPSERFPGNRSGYERVLRQWGQMLSSRGIAQVNAA